MSFRIRDTSTTIFENKVKPQKKKVKKVKKEGDEGDEGDEEDEEDEEDEIKNPPVNNKTGGFQVRNYFTGKPDYF